MIERSYRRRSVRNKQYRAVVIDAHTIFKFFALLIMVAVISVFLGIGVKSLISGSAASKSKSISTNNVAVTTETQSAKSGDADTKNDDKNTKSDEENKEISTSGTDAKSKISVALSNICEFVLGFNPYDKTDIVAAEVPGAELVNSYGLIRMSENDTSVNISQPTKEPASETQPEEDSGEDDGELEIKAINAGQNANSDTNYVKIGNQTSFDVDVSELLQEPLDFDMSADGPKVLIIHTHATEAYAPEGAKRYNSDESDRSLDTLENVVAVGEEVARIFNERGIETLHDTELHDYPSFNGAYADALDSIEQYLSDYPSIQMVFDLHRDSIVYDDGTKAKVVTKIDGRNAAQLMFVVGTNEKGLYNPDWRENLKFAVQLQDAIDQKYPNLMRYVNLRQERFNCHATHGSLIIEMGSSGNSLSEAEYGMTCAAEVIADFINGL